MIGMFQGVQIRGGALTAARAKRTVLNLMTPFAYVDLTTYWYTSSISVSGFSPVEGSH